jgi:chromosomal replication initiator protein
MSFLDLAEVMSVGRRPKRAGIDYEIVLDAVCRQFRLTRDELWSTDRSRFVSLARRTAIYLLLRLCPLSLMDVAAIMRRDHTTVIYHRDTAKADFERSAAWQAAVEVIAAEIQDEANRRETNGQ